MALKAKLRVQLIADEIVIAESEDGELWQGVLRAITAGKDDRSKTSFSKNKILGKEPNDEEVAKIVGTESAHDPVGRLTSEIGVAAEEVKAGCGPSLEKPFIHLDHHHWEALKKNTPTRGPGAVPPIVLAGTVFLLWAKYANIQAPTIPVVQEVLETIGIEDKNALRGIKKCEWIQKRNNTLSLNPAKISKAVELAKAYCSKKPLSGKE